MQVSRSLISKGLTVAVTAGVTAALTTAASAGASTSAPAAQPVAVANAGSTRLDPTQATLRQLAQHTKLRIGTAVNTDALASDPTYRQMVGAQFSTVTPENVMKWEVVEPTRGTYNFAPADELVASARRNGQLVRGHTLVWHSQLASWVSSLPAAQLQAAMENHITQEVTHFEGKLYAWDVVNEPFNDDGTFRTSPFYNAMGQDYIADAFRTARAADPSAKLYINDYNTDGTGAKADAMYNLVKTLKAAGVPIDGVGFQGHLAVQYGFPTNMQQNLQRFADLGVDVAITELDVRMITPSDATKEATQITYYTNMVKACMAVTRCKGITIWDYTDKYSWVPNTFPGQDFPLPWDKSLQKKPALYNAIITALGGTATTPTTSPTTSPTSSGPAGACKVTYTTSTWSTGYTAQVTIGNTSGSALSGWSLAFTLPSGQTITNSWNATISPASGAVTAKNVSYNGSIAANGTVSFGFQANHSGDSSKPTAFALNGTACSVA